MESLKRCIKCGEFKPLSEFHKNRASKDGLAYFCKPCNNKHASDWYKDGNRSRVVENTDKRRKKRPTLTAFGIRTKQG